MPAEKCRVRGLLGVKPEALALVVALSFTGYRRAGPSNTLTSHCSKRGNVPFTLDLRSREVRGVAVQVST